MSGHRRFSEEGSALEKVRVGQTCGTSLSRWFQHLIWISPVRRLPLETYWKVTLTDIEFIGGNIFISPPLGKPAYSQGRAGQYHPCGKRMCSAASASLSQRWRKSDIKI